LIAWLATPVGCEEAKIWARVVITVASANELVVDKLPNTPSSLTRLAS
jgi:hypothetical protein